MISMKIKSMKSLEKFMDENYIEFDGLLPFFKMSNKPFDIDIDEENNLVIKIRLK